MKVCLASGSPRRRQLLGWCDVTCEVCPQDIDESWRPPESPVAYAQRLASEKARAALAEASGLPVVAADTIVHFEGQILGKPVDRADATAMLTRLSGREHRVTTAVCVAREGHAEALMAITTRVRFRSLEPAEIEAYVATGDADDKAGAYGIQGRAGVFVAQVEGSWTNVMGLPVEETLDALKRLA